MFQLDLKNRKTIYEQIVDNIKKLIITEVVKSDEKLPSVRELSKMLTVNPNTIQKSYRELERQGFIYTVAGLGCFVADRKDTIIDRGKANEIKEQMEIFIRELFFLGLSQEEILKLFKSVLIEGRDE